MSARCQGDLFAKPKLSRRKLRAKERGRRPAFCLTVAFNHPKLSEQDICMIDGSGPPPNWRDRLERVLAADAADAGVRMPELPIARDDYTNRELLKLAIRVGRAARSIVETMPPKPEVLLEGRA
jgi:hypothetical protein